jgi:hypothetical protein
VHVELGGDFGQAVRHAGAAGDAADDALGAFQNASDDTLGAAHFPQDIGVNPAFAAGNVVGAAGLRDAALNCVSDQFIVPRSASFAVIILRDGVALGIVAVCVDGAEGANAATGGPMTGSNAVRDGHALAALDQR